MSVCSECQAKVTARAVTCSMRCRTRRSRRIRKLAHQGPGELRITLPPESRVRLREALSEYAAFCPMGFDKKRFRLIVGGRAREITAQELRAIASWYPIVLRVLRLPTVAEV